MMRRAAERPIATRHCPIEARVADLLGRMTRAEKLAQLGSVWAFEVVERGRPRPRPADARWWRDGIGQITRLAGSTNLRAAEVAEMANAIQRYLVEETRLGIPAIIHEESPPRRCSPGARRASSSPSARRPRSIPDARRRRWPATIRRRMLPDRRPPGAGARARHRARPALGADRGDVRRGSVPGGRDRLRLCRGAPGRRTARTASSRPPSTWSATGSRRAGSTRRRPTSVRASCATSSSSRSRRPSVDGGIASVMPAYCDVDGVPCHASRELLDRDPARRVGLRRHRRLGLHGHRDARDRPPPDRGPRRGRAAWRSRPGVDPELPRTVAFGAPARERHRRRAGRRGTARCGRRPGAAHEVPPRPLRAPVRRRPDRARPWSASPRTEAAAARDLAERSLVLLENDGVLPLAPDRAASRSSDRSPTAPATCSVTTATWSTSRRSSEMRRGGDALGGHRRRARHVALGDELTGRRTILDALRARCRAEVVHARGSGHHDGTDAEHRRGRRRSPRRGRRDRGPRRAVGPDRRIDDRRVPRSRRARAARPAAGAARGASSPPARRSCWWSSAVGRWRSSGPPTVAPRSCSPGCPATPARRRSPTSLSGRREPQRQAARDDAAPRGPGAADLPPPPDGRPLATRRATMSTARSRRSGRSASAARTRRSRSTDLRARPDVLATTGGEVAVRVDVTNTGRRAGDEVVQLYVRDEEATVARPVRELRGLPPAASGGRGMPDGHLPPLHRAVLLRRRGSTAASSSPVASACRSAPPPSTCR